MENLPLNLHRLLYFHHRSAKDAARALGVSENSISAWLGGTRDPSGGVLLRIAGLYDVDARALYGDPYAFAAVLGDEQRIRRAEANLETTTAGSGYLLGQEVIERHIENVVTKFQPKEERSAGTSHSESRK